MLEVIKISKLATSGELEVVFPRMSLVCTRGEQEFEVLTGNGLIATDVEGRIRYRMTVSNRSNSWEQSFADSSPGIIQSSQFKVHATDPSSREWISGEFSLSPHAVIGVLSNEISGFLPSITKNSDPLKVKKPGRSIVFIGNPRLRYRIEAKEEKYIGQKSAGKSMSRSVDELFGGTVRIQDIDRSFVLVEAVGDRFLSDLWPRAVLTGIGLVSASLLSMVAMHELTSSKNKLTIYSGPHRFIRTSLPPPVWVADGNTAEEGWDYLQRHMDCCLSDPKYSEASSGEVDAILFSSIRSMQSACISAAVAVECLASIVLADFEVERSVSPEDIVLLNSLVDSWQGSDAVKKRLHGYVSSVQSVRTVDRINEWSKLTGIPEHAVKGWKQVRDRVAHGTYLQMNQENHDKYFCAIEIFYRLLAHRIGYVGLITPSSKPGWGISPAIKIVKDGKTQ